MDYIEDYLKQLPKHDLKTLFTLLFKQVTLPEGDSKWLMTEYLKTYYMTSIDRDYNPKIPPIHQVPEIKIMGEKTIRLKFANKKKELIDQVKYTYPIWYPPSIWDLMITHDIEYDKKTKMYSIVFRRNKYPRTWIQEIDPDPYMSIEIGEEDILTPSELPKYNKLYIQTPHNKKLRDEIKAYMPPDFLLEFTQSGDFTGLLATMDAIWSGKKNDKYDYWKVILYNHPTGAKFEMIEIQDWIFGVGSDVFEKFHRRWLKAHKMTPFQLQFDDDAQTMLIQDLESWLKKNNIDGIFYKGFQVIVKNLEKVLITPAHV